MITGLNIEIHIMNKTTVLFICTHNSARSQMAEGYLSNRYGERYTAYSAGTEVTRVHPLAIEVMDEIDIDISGNRSKPLIEFFDTDIDIVVTVCDGAKAVCPVFPKAKRTIHQSFVDPVKTSAAPEESKEAFRKIRNEIIHWIDVTFGNDSTLIY